MGRNTVQVRFVGVVGRIDTSEEVRSLKLKVSPHICSGQCAFTSHRIRGKAENTQVTRSYFLLERLIANADQAPLY